VGSYFFDSSALAKRYQPEAGSDRVEAIFRQPQRRLIISRLTAVELHSVFAGRVRMGTLSPADAAALRNHSLNDVATAVLTVVAIADHHYAEAERLLKQHGNLFRLRTLDALQSAWHWMYTDANPWMLWWRQIMPSARARRRVCRSRIRKVRDDHLAGGLDSRTHRSYAPRAGCVPNPFRSILPQPVFPFSPSISPSVRQ